MAVMNQGETVNLLANGDLSAKQYTFVKQDSATTVAAATASTDVGLYVLQNAPASGICAEVVGCDETLLKMGATGVIVGSKVMCSTGGLGIPATGAGNMVQAVAREAGTTGDIVRVQLVGPYPIPST